MAFSRVRAVLTSGVAVVALALLGPGSASAQANGCQYILGFSTLHNLIATISGNCVDNQAFAADGDALQHTTTGLMAWRKRDNWTAFTNGYQTWINGPNGIQERLNIDRFAWEPDYSRSWQAPVNGRPLFQTGSPSAFYIWHDEATAPHWHLSSTDPAGVTHTFGGTITTDGTFAGVAGVALEQDDSIQRPNPSTISFTFVTASGIDGLAFSVDRGRSLTFNLTIDGQPAPTNQIVLGAGSTGPTANPFTFTRR